MNQTQFAVLVIGCSKALWCHTLKGERNLGYEKAKRASDAMGTSVDLWMNPEASVKNRLKAWEKYKREVSRCQPVKRK